MKMLYLIFIIAVFGFIIAGIGLNQKYSILSFSQKQIQGSLDYLSSDSKITSSEYTPSTDKNCIDNTCNLVLYSGIRNVYEDEKWKRVKDARSLKGSGIDCVVNYDGVHKVECLDWNLTARHLSFELNDDSKLNTDIPIKIFKDEVIDGEIVKKEKKEKEQKIKLKSKEDKETLWIHATEDEEIHFGEESTTIILQTANTHNLGDSYIREASFAANTNYGTATNMILNAYSGANYWSVLKFNISSIHPDATIINSSLNLYVYTNYLSAGESFNTTIHSILNQTWTESQVTWNNLPSYNSSKSGYLLVDSALVNKWAVWDVTEGIASDLKRNYKNSSMVIKATEGVGISSGDSIFIYSKENADSAKPYLNITYYEPLIINNPINNQKFLNVKNITLNTTNTDYSNTVWYSYDNGVTNTTLCTGSGYCYGSYISSQGYFNITVWANNSNNLISSRTITNLLVANNTVLQTANTHNLGDSFIYENSPTSNYGTLTYVRLLAYTPGRYMHMFFKFNISMIPNSAIIDETNLNLYLYSNALSAGESQYADILSILNQTWTETQVTWNIQPQINNSVLNTNYIDHTSSGWFKWDFKEGLQSDLLRNYQNSSMVIQSSNGVGIDTSDYVYFYSKENADSRKPYLNITYYEAPTDTIYPLFSNYWDNNGTLTDSGTGLFNVTVQNTNGTVLLEINGSNYTARNLTANVYNVSVEFSLNGTYAYRWHSWGNGTDENYNVSAIRYYTVDAVADDTTFLVTLPAETSHLFFNASTKDDKLLPPQNQTDSVPSLNISNEGNVNLNFLIILNASMPSGVILMANINNSYTHPKIINNSSVPIYDGLTPGNTFGIWFWSNATNVAPMNERRQLNVTTIQE